MSVSSSSHGFPCRVSHRVISTSVGASICAHMKRKHGSQLVRIRYQVADQMPLQAQRSSTGSGLPALDHSSGLHSRCAVTPDATDEVPNAIVQARHLAPRRDAPVVLHSARGSKDQALRSAVSVQTQLSRTRWHAARLARATRSSDLGFRSTTRGSLQFSLIP